MDPSEKNIANNDHHETLSSVSERTLCDLGNYADNVMKRLAHNLRLSRDMNGKDFASLALLKALNADRALRDGHAAIINGRIQLTREARGRPEIRLRYEAGLRYWDRGRHNLTGFLRLVMLSDIRAWAKKQLQFGEAVSEDEHRRSDDSRASLLDAIPATGNSPEENVAEAELFEQFTRVLDSSELKAIANRILFEKASITDLMLEFGLTRSQVEKRIRKIIETAKALSDPEGSH